MRFFSFSFFNGCLVWVVSFSWCLWSLALCEAQIMPLSCLVNCLYNYINNLFTISSFTLYYMHLILWHNLNIFLTIFFFNGSGHGLFGSSRVDPQKNQVGSRVNPFLLRVKKIGFGSSRVKKFWLVFPCLIKINKYKFPANRKFPTDMKNLSFQSPKSKTLSITWWRRQRQLTCKSTSKLWRNWLPKQRREVEMGRRGRDGSAWVSLRLGAWDLGWQQGQDGLAWVSGVGQGSWADEELKKKEKKGKGEGWWIGNGELWWRRWEDDESMAEVWVWGIWVSGESLNWESEEWLKSGSGKKK